MINQIILISLAVLLVLLAGLFAGAETGMYRLSRLRLRVGIERKKFSFVILGKILHDSSALLISMLIFTNLAYYITTSIVAYILLGVLRNEHTAELFTTLLIAPVLFVFSELIPKNLFFYRADSIMPFVSPILLPFHKVFTWCGVVPLLKFVSRSFGRPVSSPFASKTVIFAVRQPHIRAVLHETREEGLFSHVQSDIMSRMVSLSNVDIGSVMTPIDRVQSVSADSDSTALLNVLEKSAFTRLPVYEHSPANIFGFINIYDCLNRPEPLADLRKLVKPIRKLPETTIITEAINVMQAENQKIVLVTRTTGLGRERPVGIVTMKDLVEELLGELTEW